MREVRKEERGGRREEGGGKEEEKEKEKEETRGDRITRTPYLGYGEKQKAHKNNLKTKHKETTQITN